MPYLAPLAAMPIISWAPRFAERNARPAVQAGMWRPASRNSPLFCMRPRSAKPIPRTTTPERAMMRMSMSSTCTARIIHATGPRRKSSAGAAGDHLDGAMFGRRLDDLEPCRFQLAHEGRFGDPVVVVFTPVAGRILAARHRG